MTPSFSQAEYLDDPTPAIDVPTSLNTALFVQALLFGLGGVLAGAALDAGFIALTHINVGYLAIAVAWLVAKAMVTGSRGEGGRPFQIAALVLTYLSVSLAHAALLYIEIRRDGTAVALNAHNLIVLLRYGVASPFLRFQDSAASALIGLFILFIGMRAAWRMTSGDPAAVRHPFAR